jgi:hypothetical protein
MVTNWLLKYMNTALQKKILTDVVGRLSIWSPWDETLSVVPKGVTGRELVRFAAKELMTFLKENDLAAFGLSCSPSDDVPGFRRITRSPSGAELLALKLWWGTMFLIDDFVLVKLRLGGRPALVELGLTGMLILVEVGTLLSNVLAGICKERLGLRGLCPVAIWALASWSGACTFKQQYSQQPCQISWIKLLSTGRNWNEDEDTAFPWKKNGTYTDSWAVTHHQAHGTQCQQWSRLIVSNCSVTYDEAVMNAEKGRYTEVT